MTQQEEKELLQGVKDIREAVAAVTGRVAALENPPASTVEKKGGFNHNHFAILVALLFLPLAAWAFWGSTYELKKLADIAFRLAAFHVVVFGFYWFYQTVRMSTDEAVFNTANLRAAFLIAYGLSVAYILQP